MSLLPKHWHATENWVDRVLPWPKLPTSITDHRAWEVYYRQKADVASSRLALALLTVEAVIEDSRLYGTVGLTYIEIELLEKVRNRLAEPPNGSEPATGLAQGAEADPASIPESNEKGVYP